MSILEHLLEQYDKNVEFVGGENRKSEKTVQHNQPEAADNPGLQPIFENKPQNVENVACTRERDQYIFPSSSLNISKNNISLLRASNKFNKIESNPIPRDLNPEKCFVCGSDNFWRLKTNDRWICHICHPPGPPKGAIVYRIHANDGDKNV
jgi:hypothetical protein